MREKKYLYLQEENPAHERKFLIENNKKWTYE